MLREGANAVTIAVPGDTGAVVDSAVLDWVEITYLRKMTVQGDQNGLAGNGRASRFKLTGFSTDNLLLWDVSEPMTPTLLNGFTTAKNEGGFALRFHDNGPRPALPGFGARSGADAGVRHHLARHGSAGSMRPPIYVVDTPPDFRAVTPG